MNLKDIKVQILQKDFATRSDDYLLGFQAGADAALKAIAESAVDGLPTITKEQGVAMRTGQALPALSPEAQHALTELQRKLELTGCTSYVQRKLQVGFSKACRILEELEENGWITQPDNAGARRWLRSVA